VSPDSRAVRFLSHLYRLILVKNRLLNAARFSCQPRISLEALEPRLLLSTTLAGGQEFNESIAGDGQSIVLDGAGAIDVTLRLDGPDVVAIRNADRTEMARQSLAATSDILILGGSGDDRLTVDFSGGNPLPAGGLTFDGGTQATSAGDSLVLVGGSFGTIVHRVANASDGQLEIDGRRISYTGLEPIDDNLDTVDRVFEFTSGADELIELSDDGDPGNNRSFIDSSDGESVTFLNPTNSLTIMSDGVLSGADAIHISGLDPAFSADLKVLGNAGDFVRLMSPGIYTHGGDLEISAGGIGSDTGVTISTRQVSGGDHLNGVSTGNSGSITLTASDILHGSNITISSGTRLLAHVEDGSGFGAGDITLEADHSGYREATVLLPVSVALREAGISITDATLTGADIAIRSTAADLTLSDDLGAYSEQFTKSFVSLLNQLPGMAISALTGISVQVNYRHSDAAVTLLGTSVTSSGSVDIGATAKADASLSIVALSGLLGQFSFAFGYGEAKATAETLIDGCSIAAEGGVNVASDVTSEAYLKARTSGLMDSDDKSSKASVAFAVANTEETSHVTVTRDSTITSRDGGVTINALGKVNNYTVAETKLSDKGYAGLGFALGFDKADIRAQVDGTVDAGGSERAYFDPTAANVVNVAQNALRLPGHSFTEGQRLLYRNGGGADIGGLEDGTEYYVHVVDADTIQLLTTETSVIDLDNGQVDPLAQHTLSLLAYKDFNSSCVVPDTDDEDESEPHTITIPAHGFAEDQVVAYIGNQDGPVEGLENRREYKVHVLDPDVIQLCDLDTDVPIVITDSGEGLQAFVYEVNVQTFTPATAVDSVTDTIALPGHGFQTGDSVLYRTDPGITHDVVLNQVAEDGTPLDPLGTVTVPDTPIHGLESVYIYWVVKVDDDTVRLATTKEAAFAAEEQMSPIDLTDTGEGTRHSLQAYEGIGIHATLDAINQQTAGATFDSKDGDKGKLGLASAVLNLVTEGGNSRRTS